MMVCRFREVEGEVDLFPLLLFFIFIFFFFFNIVGVGGADAGGSGVVFLVPPLSR